MLFRTTGINTISGPSLILFLAVMATALTPRELSENENLAWFSCRCLADKVSLTPKLFYNPLQSRCAGIRPRDGDPAHAF